MPNPAKVVTALTAAALTVMAPLHAHAQPPAAEGKVIVFVTEGSEPSGAGTRLKEYVASTTCQILPPGAHVIANDSGKRLRLYSDSFCVMPAPPPFNFINPGYGAHVSPTGAFKAG